MRVVAFAGSLQFLNSCDTGISSNRLLAERELLVVDVEAREGLDHIDLTVGIVAAYVSNNSLPPFELPSFITRVYAALAGLPDSGFGLTESKDTIEKATAGQIRKSITSEALISFIDGKPYKTLKRHLSARGLDADTYRARYGLPADYPMVATSYSATRSTVAKNLGFGRKLTA